MRIEIGDSGISNPRATLIQRATQLNPGIYKQELSQFRKLHFARSLLMAFHRVRTYRLKITDQLLHVCRDGRVLHAQLCLAARVLQ
jgi:hypothetical protein